MNTIETTKNRKQEWDTLCRKAKYVFAFLVIAGILASGVVLVIAVIKADNL